MDLSVRLDKWLWAARFFKTRSVAREAVAGGKVHLNGKRAKPGRSINIGDELSIQRGEEEYTITIVEPSARRGPAVVARTLYEESEENRIRREKLAETRKLEHQQHATREQRPDKRQRRRLVRFKSGLD
jgi:ribosome-associated heat shock protein Hsp15